MSRSLISGADGVVPVPKGLRFARMIMDFVCEEPPRRFAPPLLTREELKIGFHDFNQLQAADFGPHSSQVGEECGSSSTETGRPAATPLRRGVKQHGLSLPPA